LELSEKEAEDEIRLKRIGAEKKPHKLRVRGRREHLWTILIRRTVECAATIPVIRPRGAKMDGWQVLRYARAATLSGGMKIQRLSRQRDIAPNGSAMVQRGRVEIKSQMV
jgi:hypothetical protein